MPPRPSAKLAPNVTLYKRGNAILIDASDEKTDQQAVTYEDWKKAQHEKAFSRFNAQGGQGPNNEGGGDEAVRPNE